MSILTKSYIVNNRCDGTIEIENKKNGRMFIGAKNDAGYTLLYDADKNEQLSFTTINYYGQLVPKRFTERQLVKKLDELSEVAKPIEKE